MTKQAMGELVAYLKDVGYVTLLPDSRDRRAKLVVLTRRGLDWYDSAVEQVGVIEDALADGLGGRTQLEDLATVLENLIRVAASPHDANAAHQNVGGA